MIEISGSQPRAAGRDAASAPDALVSKQLAAPGDRTSANPGVRRRAVGAVGHSAALGEYLLHCEPGATFLFADNETNPAALAGEAEARAGQARPASSRTGSTTSSSTGPRKRSTPDRLGTKAAAHYTFEIPAEGRQTLRLRLTSASLAHDDGALGKRFSRVLETRKREADDFYAQVIPASLSADRRAVMRQSLAGMLWSKQFYDYDVDAWLTAHGTAPRPGRTAVAAATRSGRTW